MADRMTLQEGVFTFLLLFLSLIKSVYFAILAIVYAYRPGIFYRKECLVYIAVLSVSLLLRLRTPNKEEALQKSQQAETRIRKIITRKIGLHRQGYNYRPLTVQDEKTIRLIELLPAETEKTYVRINIKEVSLLDNEMQCFQAVSHCPEGSRMQVPIFCADDKVVIWITMDLLTALKRFRLKDRSRWLWVDEICINQSDAAERSHQICFVSDIFHAASQVLVWLGAGKVASDRLKQSAPHLLRARALMDAQYADIETGQKQGDMELPSYSKRRWTDRSSRKKIQEALQSLFNSFWFHRIKVIQEVSSAKKIGLYYGDWSCPLGPIEKAWQFGLVLHSMSEDSIGRFPTSLLHTVMKVAEKDKLPLLALLTIHDKKKATDSRDYVFSLVGVAADAGHVEVDYTKTVSQVFLDTTIGIMKQTQNLDVLSQVAIRARPADSELPTWVPSWDCSRIARALVPSIPGLSAYFAFCNANATLGSRLNDNLIVDGQKLRVSGYELDTIEVVGKDIYIRNTAMTGWTNWAQISNVFSSKVYEPTGEPILDVFWQCLILGNQPYWSRVQEQWGSYRPFMKVLEWWLRLFVFLEKRRMPFPWKDMIVDFATTEMLFLKPWKVFGRMVFPRIQGADWSPAIRDMSRERVMVRTRRGWVGLSNYSVQAGDKLVLLEGANVPYVLRRTEEDGVYLLVGDAYIHGIMCGEMWEPQRCDTIWLS